MRRLGRAGLVAVLATAPLAPAATASELEVNAAAKLDGAFGLEVTTGVGCAQADLVVPAGPVTSDQTSCATIRTATPGPVTVELPGVDFLTGLSIKLDDGLIVLGDLFTAQLNPLIGSAFAFVTDDTPDDQQRYVAWFRLDVDPLSLALNEDLGLFVGYDSAGDEQFRVVLRRFLMAPELRLVVQGRDNTVGGLVEHGEQFPLTAGANQVSLWWRALAGRGQALLSVNQTPLDGIEDLDNAASRIDSVRLGLVDGNPAATSGSFYLDDFSSFRTLAP